MKLKQEKELLLGAVGDNSISSKRSACRYNAEKRGKEGPRGDGSTVFRARRESVAAINRLPLRWREER
jgi:hypothetical protein